MTCSRHPNLALEADWRPFQAFVEFGLRSAADVHSVSFICFLQHLFGHRKMKSFWKTYDMGLVPGPTRVPAEVGAAFALDFGSSDLESTYFEYYVHMQGRVQKLLHTKNEIVFMTGEAMVTLWGALKSVLKPGDVVYSIGCGTFPHTSIPVLHNIEHNFCRYFDTEILLFTGANSNSLISSHCPFSVCD